MKIRAHYEHISKIPSCGWRAWKNWFLIIATFLDRAIFQSIRSEKMGQKRTGAKMSKVSKITLFMLVDLTNEFLKYVLYLQTFLPGLLPHCNLIYKASDKNILTSSGYFEISNPKNHCPNSILRNVEYPTTYMDIIFFKSYFLMIQFA